DVDGISRCEDFERGGSDDWFQLRTPTRGFKQRPWTSTGARQTGGNSVSIILLHESAKAAHRRERSNDLIRVISGKLMGDGRRSTIVGLPPTAVPNFAKSLTVVARRGFSDAA